MLPYVPALPWCAACCKGVPVWEMCQDGQVDTTGAAFASMVSPFVQVVKSFMHVWIHFLNANLPMQPHSYTQLVQKCFVTCYFVICTLWTCGRPHTRDAYAALPAFADTIDRVPADKMNMQLMSDAYYIHDLICFRTLIHGCCNKAQRLWWKSRLHIVMKLRPSWALQWPMYWQVKHSGCLVADFGLAYIAKICVSTICFHLPKLLLCLHCTNALYALRAYQLSVLSSVFAFTLSCNAMRNEQHTRCHGCTRTSLLHDRPCNIV